MPNSNPLLGQVPPYTFPGTYPQIDVLETGIPSGIDTGNQQVFTAPDNTSGVNAAGTSENVSLHLAILIVLALVGVFVLRQSGVRFAVAAGVGR